MDGSSSVVIPSASVPGGLAREDALFRIVYYGEALRAMTEHVSDTLISGPCVPMIGLLDEAFDRMSETRDNFGPEEFTLFVMSKMLGLCDDVDEARQFQIGAAKYILKSAEALPDDYRPVIDDARQMLQRTAPLAVTSEKSADRPETEARASDMDQTPPAAPAPAEAPREKAPVTAASPAPPVSEPTPQRRPAAPPAATSRLQRLHARDIPSTAQQIRPARGPGDKRPSKVPEILAISTVILFGIGFTIMVLLGYVSPSSLTETDRERVGITLR
mgnify:CR=1 FL=1